MLHSRTTITYGRTDMADARVDIEEALKDAHLPALMAALVQMTGDLSWLRSEWTPVYNPLSRGDTGIPEDEQARIRKAAAEAIAAYLDGKPMQMLRPDHATICKQMDFVAGAPIPEQYVDFLVDELVLEERSTKDPHFEAPELRAAARHMKVLVVGAGMSGLLTGIRLSQAGVPFEIIDKNPDVGGTWYENTYPGCRVDNSNHMYSYSFEPNHAWPQHFSPQPVLLEYFRGIAAKYDLKKHIRFETQVELLAWDDARNVWRATLKGRDGKTEVVEATAVVTAVGQLNKPRFPDLPLRRVAPRRGPEGQAGGRHRHRRLVLPVRARDRTRGGQADRLPAEPTLGPARAALPRGRARGHEVDARARPLLRQVVPVLAVLDDHRGLPTDGEVGSGLERDHLGQR